MVTAFADDAHALAPAGHGKRIAAALLDAIFYAIFLGICGTVGFFIGLAIGANAQSADSDGWEVVGWVLVCAVLGLAIGLAAWFALTVWLLRRPGERNGQTLGKQVVSIRVVRADRSPVGPGLALLRELVTKWLLIWVVSGAVSALLGFADAGLIGALVAAAIWYGPAFADDRRRAVHDRLCNTLVVDAKPGSAPPVSQDDLWPAPS